MKNYLSMLFIAFFAISAFAEYNLCSTAIPINCTQSYQGTNTDANDTTIKDCANNGTSALRQTVWFLATGDGSTMTASTCGAYTDFDTKISIYNFPCAGGTATNLTCIAGDDDGCGSPNVTSLVTWATTPGTNYLIAVYGYLNSTGNFQLDLTCANTPCPESVSVYSNSPICEGENGIYTIAPSPSANPTPGGLVFYNLDGTSDFVYLDSNGEATVEVINPSVGLGSSVISLTEIRNQNNLCPLALSNGASVSVDPNPVLNSMTAINNPICDGTLIGWNLDYTAGASFSINLLDQAGDIVTGGTATTNSVVYSISNNNLTYGSYTVQMTSLTLGNCTVDPSNIISETVNYGPTVTNDDCSTAISMTCGETVFGNNSCAVTQYGLNDCLYAGYTYDYNALWYSFVGDGSTINATTCNDATDFDNAVLIYSGECDNLVCVSGNDNGCGMSNGPAVAVAETTPGVVYYIVVAGFEPTDFGNFGLSIGCANTPCPESVSVYSNSPICEGENGIYTIAPSPSANPTPGGLVFYNLDGTSDFVYLDINGEATVEVINPSVGLGSSVISLTEIRNQNNLCPLALSNGASVSVDPNPVLNSMTAINNPICDGTLIGWNLDYTAGASFSINLLDQAGDIVTGGTATTNSVVYSISNNNLTYGSYTVQMTSLTLGNCTVDPSNIISETVNYGPTVTNDDCTTAMSITCGDIIQGNTTCAEMSVSPNCYTDGIADFYSKSLFYNFIGDGSTITASTCSSSNTSDWNALMYLYSGDCSNLICQTYGNDECSSFPELTFTTVPGLAYYIMVGGFDLNEYGAFELSINCTNAPCPESVSVTSNGPLCEGENAAYLIAPSPTAGISPASTVYYTLDGVNGSVVLDNNGQEVVEVLNPPVGVPSSVIVLDSVVNQAGTCSVILSNGASVSVNPTPVNDVCEMAIPMVCSDTQVGNNTCARVQSLFDCGGNTGFSLKGLWYSFEGDGSTINATTCSNDTDFDAYVQIYEGSCEDGVFCVTGPNNNCNGNVAVAATSVGVTYYIVVSGETINDVGNFSLSIACEGASCPSNLILNANPELAGTYQADDFIESTSTINAAGGAVTYKAGDEYILLDFGFVADGTSEFIAVPEDCDPDN